MSEQPPVPEDEKDIVETEPALTEDIETEPELVNNSPYDKGWIIKMELSKDVDLNDLLSAEEYKNLIE